MDQSMNALGAAPPTGLAQTPPEASADASPAPAQSPGEALESTPSSDLMAQYAKLRSAETMIDTVQNGLVTLAKLGDTVTMEDVVKEAGVLVAKGLDPIGMASMLADAPEKGDLLSEWVDQHLQDTAMRAAQLQFITRSVRHEIGVRAMRGLMTQHAENTPEGQDDVAASPIAGVS